MAGVLVCFERILFHPTLLWCTHVLAHQHARARARARARAHTHTCLAEEAAASRSAQKSTAACSHALNTASSAGCEMRSSSPSTTLLLADRRCCARPASAAPPSARPSPSPSPSPSRAAPRRAFFLACALGVHSWSCEHAPTPATPRQVARAKRAGRCRSLRALPALLTTGRPPPVFMRNSNQSEQPHKLATAKLPRDFGRIGTVRR